MRCHGISDKGGVEYGISTRKAEKKIYTVVQHLCAAFHVLFVIMFLIAKNNMRFLQHQLYHSFISISDSIYRYHDIHFLVGRTYLFL